MLIIRIVLGYQRMADRFRASVSEVLAEKAVASQEGAVEALAVAAARQQQRQAALAYMLLLYRGLQYEYDDPEQNVVVEAGAAVKGAPAAYDIRTLRVGTAAQVQAHAEQLLLQKAGLRVRADAAYGMLVRTMGLRALPQTSQEDPEVQADLRGVHTVWAPYDQSRYAHARRH